MDSDDKVLVPDLLGTGIEVSGLRMEYKSRTKSTVALEGCNLSVESGTRTSLLGASGCGKSTLLRILADIVQPTEGTALIGGLSPREARKRRVFALVSQQSVMLPWRRIRENVELGLEIIGLDRKERQARAQEAIELVGLAGFERSYPTELSGGMRQRAAIARALALRPKVLLMDEPFGALDEFTREHLNFELLSILDETRATLVLVTHSISEAVLMSDSVVVMSPRPGRIVHTADIDFGRHRTPRIRDLDEFAAYERELRHALEGSHGSGLAVAPRAKAS